MLPGVAKVNWRLRKPPQHRPALFVRAFSRMIIVPSCSYDAVLIPAEYVMLVDFFIGGGRADRIEKSLYELPDGASRPWAVLMGG